MLPWMKEKIFGSRQKFLNIWNRRAGLGVNLDSTEKSDVYLEQQIGMFVSDNTSLFPTDVLKLTVISIEGDVYNIDARPEFTLETVKAMSLSHFYNNLESAKLSANFKLILVSDKRSLEGERSVGEEDLKNNDELLLVERRQTTNTREQFTEENLRGPTEEEIRVATLDIQEKNTFKLHPPNECSADFQSEIRKILISLVEASARVLTPSPRADEVFALVRERLEARTGVEPDPRAVRQLVDMGFSRAAASRALRVNRHNEAEALEWLLDRSGGQNDTDEEPGESSGGQGRRRPPDAPRSQSAPNVPPPAPPPPKGSAHTVVDTVGALLESFRACKRLDFKPNPRALQNLIDMGFPEAEIRDALRITGNNQGAACDWLLGERRPSLEDLDTGLDVEGPIYRAIMANPAIQLSLTNPKMLLAFLSMLETPSTANMWINDPDASPVLSQIFKTYHAEKHAMQMNRYVEQQHEHQRQQQQQRT